MEEHNIPPQDEPTGEEHRADVEATESNVDEDKEHEQEDVEAEEKKMKEQRREELLSIARKSRLRWILEAREKDISQAKKASQKREDSAEFYKKVPAAGCLQTVVNFLVDVTADNGDDYEHISIEALCPSDAVDDELLDLSSDDVPSYDNESMTPYAIFLDKLKHSSATEVVNMLRKFVTKIEVYIRDSDYNSQVSLTQKSMPTEKLDIPNEIWNCIDLAVSSMKENFLWSSESALQFSQTVESLEKFLFHKLYPSLFPRVAKKNAERDEALKERISSLAFLEPEHLDMRSMVKVSPDREVKVADLKQKYKSKEAVTTNAQTKGLLEAVYLLKYALPNDYVSPSEKMTCLREISQSIIATISANQPPKKKPSSASTTEVEKSKVKDLPGADDLLPGLILAIKEANPPHLLSTIDYLESYLSPKKLVSEAGYILTQFVSAVQFLQRVNAAALTISPLEFEESMYRCMHEGKSRMRILQEENEMKEKLAYKKQQQLQQGVDGAAAAIASRSDKLQQQSQLCSVHEIYNKIKCRNVSRDEIDQPVVSAGDSMQCSARRRAFDAVDKRACRALVRAHDGYSGSDAQARRISAWCCDSEFSRAYNIDKHKTSNDSERLISYFDSSPDMLTMKDIPRMLAEYKFLVKACAAMSEHCDR